MALSMEIAKPGDRVRVDARGIEPKPWTHGLYGRLLYREFVDGRSYWTVELELGQQLQQFPTWFKVGTDSSMAVLTEYLVLIESKYEIWEYPV